MSTVKTLTWLVLISWIAGGAYWHVCQIKQLCDGNPEPVVVSEEVSSTEFDIPALDIQDANSFHVTSIHNLGFARSRGGVSTEAVQPQLQSLAVYLKANPRKTVKLVGYYASDEENNTAFQSLGLARADAIKQYFLKLGVPDKQVLTEAEQRALAFSPADSSYGAGFVFSGTAEVAETLTEEKLTETTPPTSTATSFEVPKGQTEEELAAAATYESIFRPMELYFPLSSNQFIRTKDNETFFNEVKKYLKQNPNKRLILTGHTDSEGPDDSNLRLSKSRAEAVKRQFVRKGIKPDQIITIGKGETQPLADNTLPAGRKANRRVTMAIDEQKM
ncbi:OmpA family protein [Siphonobacter sp. SORGH_AS_0500]|uniref:OmpA family protein n=1 Tax=Siphonobacter sp. SORGH_AS_0500 TaxID=1864824 RepID=UPI000CBD9001|nr:OmpA family protein [Siphonobacter sp. SORGH_AS_0500]MDR6195543.1 OOP family OmpA-OmpF porin [Siphonobacter sp. SORGH_AS_0500]PKK35348.1 hypothetical protein BWI96_17640 [Siphonobacter sp. SORGH_AS_0500]